MDVTEGAIVAIHSATKNHLRDLATDLDHTNGLYTQAPCGLKVAKMFKLLLETVIPSIVLSLVNGEVPLVLPGDRNIDVTPFLWLILATMISPTTFALLLAYNEMPREFQFDPRMVLPLVNALPLGKDIFDIHYIYANMDSRIQTLRYFTRVVYASVMMGSIQNDMPYVQGCFPHVTAMLELPLVSAMFLRLSAWQFQDARLVSFLQSATYQQVLSVNEAIEQAGSGGLDSCYLDIIVRDACHQDAKVSATQLIESFPRFHGLAKELMIEMVNLYGFKSMLHLWHMFYMPCCRLTYQPITNCVAFDQLHMSGLHHEYVVSFKACTIMPHFMEFMLRRHAIIMDLMIPRSVMWPNGIEHVLSVNEKLGGLMYSSNPFGSNFARDVGIEFDDLDVDCHLVYSRESVMLINEHIVAWKDPIAVLLYDNRRAVAAAFSSYLVSCEVIHTIQAEEFVAFMDGASLEQVLWLQNGGVNGPYND